jgi:hypothetical protein
MKISIPERVYLVILLTVALLMGISNNLLGDQKLSWFGSPQVLEKPPELKESEL